ncbi:phosphatase PAP2 family protein [Streptomyces formicae]|uniref:Phosphatase PAP2 family protein n=1 Tax=Streptomyces formicae TaxID=1616117 RepID=A0ABY3WKI4_9ACTN|nr:phosphatase PAP2 family protein [Streptomyces formicae]UNM13127.1 phosphatase PAP2 family protein [Streptomyces formicae]
MSLSTGLSRSALQGLVRRRGLVTAAGALVLLVVVYWLMVRTGTGQRFEDAALRGTLEYADRHERAAANGRLRAISMGSLAFFCVLIVLIGVVRKRWLPALASLFTLIGGLGVAEVLKRYVVVRPLLYGQSDEVRNSFPSGHTTIAMAGLFALLIVVAPRWRGLVALLGALWAVGIGANTVSAHWHRLSDTIGGGLIALAFGAVALAVLASLGRVAPLPAGKAGRVRLMRIAVLVLGFLAVTGLALGILFTVLYARDAGRAGLVEDANWEAYLAAQSFASAASAITALAMLALLRGLDFGGPPDLALPPTDPVRKAMPRR